MSGSGIAKTPEPPYDAVIFTNQRNPGDKGYGETTNRMVKLAGAMPGFLGVEFVRDAQGLGITVSCWRDEAAIRNRRENAEHIGARRRGRQDRYEHFEVRVAKVERAYGMAESAFAREAATPMEDVS